MRSCADARWEKEEEQGGGVRRREGRRRREEKGGGRDLRGLVVDFLGKLV